MAPMVVFWTAAGLLAVAAAAVILLRAARSAPQSGLEDPTLDVYRRQLAEIDDLADRGLMEPAEREAARAEAGRRLLGAAETARTGWTAPTGQRSVLLASAAGVGLVALAGYLILGRPDLPDQPLDHRIETWRAGQLTDLTPPQLAAVLREALKVRPEAEGYRFLALAEAQSDNPAAAARALRRAIDLAPGRADLWEMLGLSLLARSQGEVTAEAREVLAEAVRLDPRSLPARFHLARSRAASGDRDGAVRDLQAIAAELPPADPRRADIDAAIREVQAPAAPVIEGPASDMIGQMVAGLAKRLRDNPDDPEGWVRLVRSYAVLGDAPRRDAALDQARRRYAAQPQVLDQLEKAAAAEPMK
ncbi:MAG: c-type cytochrome biogenesis protein CcmI [Phenylobacterium sp.]|nr:c-type cytochrome biogenesis protein CcmI [Phenylobacterium sp.]MCA4916480.1 c-type cytochrome biogenesis protein CcmI [Phenylobacterium sp.]MCA6283154.1 c-type cytochrome biogenesis protein CcmI [Phenylobacterium sp.]